MSVWEIAIAVILLVLALLWPQRMFRIVGIAVLAVPFGLIGIMFGFIQDGFVTGLRVQREVNKDGD